MIRFRNISEQQATSRDAAYGLGGGAGRAVTQGNGISTNAGGTKTGFARRHRFAKVAVQRFNAVASQFSYAASYLGDACERGVIERIDRLARDIEAADWPFAPNATEGVESTGYFVRSALPGASIFAKSKRDSAVDAESHAYARHLKMLFGAPDKIVNGRQS